jgi:hypothetical protein
LGMADDVQIHGANCSTASALVKKQVPASF